MMNITITNVTKLINKLLLLFKVKPSVLHLGRWNIENCNKRINKKIDLANEDHCGPCGNNFIFKNK
jgi:hypothetical protein